MGNGGTRVGTGPSGWITRPQRGPLRSPRNSRRCMAEPAQVIDVRRAGVLLHVTSLPPTGSGEPGRPDTSGGDLGDAAYRFVDFLADAGCTVWQVLPLVPTHEDDGSPYNALSSMAGNPALISPARRTADGLDDVAALDPASQEAFAAWCVE